jgi:hypothetical protein
MTPRHISDLVTANRPRQFDLIEKTLEVFGASDTVTQLLVRGSFAAGTADRLSDIDYVVGVRDDRLTDFLLGLDTLLRSRLGTLFPGWRDTIVGDLGGVGYVYLVPYGEMLHQLDLYVVPESRIPSVLERVGATLVHGTVPAAGSVLPDRPLALPAVRRSAQDLIVESLVILHMIAKRVHRRQPFIVYAETCLLTTALRDLVKLAFAPVSRHWGWYYLEEEVGQTPAGRESLDVLGALVAMPPIADASAHATAFRAVERLAALAAPAKLADLEPALTAFRHYSGLA